MANAPKGPFIAKLALPLAALALASCGSEKEAEQTYEAGVTDVGGGELIVTDPNEPRVEDLKLPETPMTPVPPGEEEEAATNAPTPAAEPAE